MQWRGSVGCVGAPASVAPPQREMAQKNRVALLGRGKRKAGFAGNLVRAAGGGVAVARVQFRVQSRTRSVPMAQGKVGAAPCGACSYV